jgi:Cys-tRNA(Pro)/Cys-tRNA(Cys) deacylase
MRTNDVDTPALAALQDKDLGYEIIRTKPARSAEESAELQGIEIHQLLRTIVLRRAENDYLFVLVPGGRAIDWPKLRAHLGVSRLSLPDKDEATAATGYERGAITPFGSTTTWPVIADAWRQSSRGGRRVDFVRQCRSRRCHQGHRDVGPPWICSRYASPETVALG